jgi:hypothetical protein
MKTQREVQFKVTERPAPTNTPALADTDNDDAAIRDLIIALETFQRATTNRINDFERQLAELRGKVDALVTILGGKSKSTDTTLDLPNWRNGDVASRSPH